MAVTTLVVELMSAHITTVVRVNFTLPSVAKRYYAKINVIDFVL